MANHTKTITLSDEEQKILSDSLYNDTSNNNGLDAWIQAAVDGKKYYQIHCTMIQTMQV